MKTLLPLIAALALALPLEALAVTRGEVMDMNAADRVAACAKQYTPATDKGETEADIWQMCAEVASELDRRDLSRVKARVVKAQGRDVFPPPD